MKDKHTGLYAQIEDRGMDSPYIARIRTKDTVYLWSAQYTRQACENWIQANWLEALRQAKAFPFS